MIWFNRVRQLRERGVIGMNYRNLECIAALNPRSRFPLVDSKQKIHNLCLELGVPTPKVFASIASHATMRRLPGILAGCPDDFVVKPNCGAGGRGILVVSGRAADRFVRHDGELLSLDDLRHHVSDTISGMFSLGGKTDEALVQERVLLDPAFERISFQGIADIRVIMYKNIPVMAMLRLPTRQSGGRANLHQDGIGAGVDIETGITCRAVFQNRLISHHPDSGASIVGFQVPCWTEIIRMARRISKEIGLGYLGVDIVLDRRQGPLLLEANARPGLAIQIANGDGLLSRLHKVDCAFKIHPPFPREPAHSLLPSAKPND
jgi:alpha-L-glutamate ligase-like protein